MVNSVDPNETVSSGSRLFIQVFGLVCRVEIVNVICMAEPGQHYLDLKLRLWATLTWTLNCDNGQHYLDLKL